MTGVFVTATGTDIGKSFVTAGLVREMRHRGMAINALKPVVSGFNPGQAAGSDSGILLSALGKKVTPETLDEISPWRFAAPLSPDMAAQREGKTVDFDALIAFSRRAIDKAPDLTMIEGIGGVMVPLDEHHTVVDWIAVLALPSLLICGSYLGTISHTLTTLDVLARRNIEVVAVIVNETPGSAVDLEETAASLRRFAGPSPVISLPRLSPEETRHPALQRIADLL